MATQQHPTRQLAGLLALAGIVPLAIVATVLLLALWRSEQAQLAHATEAAARAAAASLERLEAHELARALQAQLGDTALSAAVAEADGRIIARAGSGALALGTRLDEPLAAAARGQRHGGLRLAADSGRDIYVAWARVENSPWTVIVQAPAMGAEAAAARSSAALGAILIAVLVASSLFAWLVGRRLVDHAARARTLAAQLEEARERLANAEAERRRADAERQRLLAEESRARRLAESASRAKDEFLAMLGHELRNPLGAIGNAVRVIDRLPSSSADHKAAREIIGRQTQHLAKIVDDLLDVGRVVSGRISLRRHLLDLAQATASAVGTVRAATTQAYEWQLDLAPVLVSADPTRIDQVLANLLDNAVKFTPPGGRISLRLHTEAGEAVLSIEDTGPGIRPELLPEVFDLFAKEGLGPDGGLGIGLTLVRRLVELHGGAVSAENRPEGGARFVVRLPAIPEPEAAPGPRRALPLPRPPRQARVLIVEDNDDARVTLQRILQAEGHLVSAARDAKAALDAAAAGSPNIAVVDIGLPGMDGYALARALRERLGSGVRLIALTGYGSAADRQRAAEAGFDAHLTKPVDFDRLLAMIAAPGP